MKFITLFKRTFILGLLALALGVALIFCLNKTTEKSAHFQFDNSFRYIFCENSHMQLAINDTLVEHAINIGESGENFIYTYQKLKCLLNGNPQVELIFLECSNSSICEYIDGRSWNAHFVKTKVPKFSFALDKSDWSDLIQNAPFYFINAACSGAELELKFILSSETYFPDFAKWDGYYWYSKSAVDSLIHAPDTIRIPSGGMTKSLHALKYLGKIENLCKAKGVRLCLIRCPVHPGWEYNDNEAMYSELFRNELSHMTLFDFHDYALPNGDFRDYEHLNCYGEQKFSVLVDSLLKARHFNNRTNPITVEQEMEALATQP